MADALDSKSSGLRPVWVQLPPPALENHFSLRCCCDCRFLREKAKKQFVIDLGLVADVVANPTSQKWLGRRGEIDRPMRDITQWCLDICPSRLFFAPFAGEVVGENVN